jgi:tetratricopeptide (TPR) repeat protein
MRKTIFLLTLWAVVGFSAAKLPAQTLSDTTLDGLIHQGIDLTLQQKYPDAKVVFQSVMELFPEHPSGYLCMAATLQAECTDYGERMNRKTFDSLLAQGQILAEHMINSHEDSVWGFYYVGTAQAYRAFSESEEGKLYNAIMDGVSSAKMFEQCLSLDSTFYDAMAGLGTYYYWRSKKTEFLSWLPFISDRKDEGIRLVNEAMDHGTYDRFVARNALIWIYINEHRLDDALKIIEKGLASYPENRSFLWGLLSTTERMGDSVAIKNCVVRLLASIMQAPVRNIYGEITCRLKLAQFAMAAGDYDSAMHECDLILAYRSDEGKTLRDIAEKIEKAEDLKAEASGHVAKH